MNEKTLTLHDLHQFTGSETWYRYNLNPKFLYTEGVQHLAEHGECYWLIDEILLAQPENPGIRAEEFQVWKLEVREDRSALLSLEYGNGNVISTKTIPWTDFPLASIELWFANNTLYLPSEH